MIFGSVGFMCSNLIYYLLYCVSLDKSGYIIGKNRLFYSQLCLSCSLGNTTENFSSRSDKIEEKKKKTLRRYMKKNNKLVKVMYEGDKC